MPSPSASAFGLGQYEQTGNMDGNAGGADKDVGAEAMPVSPIDEEREDLRARLAVAVTLLGSLELQARLAAKLDEDFARLVRDAHAEACHQVADLQRRLRDLKSSRPGTAA